MATSGAVYRMRLSHPNELVPKAIFFYSTPFTQDKERDWFDCFPLKAAAIYLAIFDQDANDKSIQEAKRMFEIIAKNCLSVIQEKKKLLEESTSQERGKATAVKEKNYGPSREVRQDLPDEILVTMDAVYMVMGFLRDLIEINDREKLDSYCMSRHGIQVVSDMAMVENQLPLGVIIDVVKSLETAMKRAANELKLNKDSTVLTSVDKEWCDAIEKFKLKYNNGNFDDVVTRFAWYYSPFCNPPFNVDRAKFQVFTADVLRRKKSLLDCLHHFVAQPDCGDDKIIQTTKCVRSVPTVKELFQAGVQFKARADQHLAIGFTAPVLSLPVMFIDAKLETVVLNLAAMESANSSRPVTRYFQLLNELVDDVGDVKMLKKLGIVKGRWKKEEDVVNLVKRVDGYASYLSIYPAMDHEIEAMKKYYEERMSKFFVRNRPAVGWIYSIATASLIFTTAIFAAKRRATN